MDGVSEGRLNIFRRDRTASGIRETPKESVGVHGSSRTENAEPSKDFKVGSAVQSSRNL